MACSSIKEFNEVWWTEIYNRIIGAVVFIDDASAECLHWEGGFFNLMSRGAVGVKSLSPFECCPKDCKKAVFITQATSVQLSTVREIIEHSDLTHCILISCVSLDVVYLEQNEGNDVTDVLASGRGPIEAAKQLEQMLYECIGKKECMVDVVHAPIFTIEMTGAVFMTPPFQHIYPSIDGVLTTDTVSDLYALSSEERARVRRLASGLNSLLESMDLKEDVYFMGTYSSLVAGVLENSPVSLARRKKCAEPASLILIDRTLDLCSVTSHSSESLLDKIMYVLPRFPGHANDVAVDMSPLCEAKVMNHPEDMQLSPGCIYHATDDACVQTFEEMIHKTKMEVMVDLYNKLSRIDLQNSASPQNLSKITPQSVEKIIGATKGNYEVIMKHLGLLQQALAIVQTLKSPKRAQIELLMSLEKQVLQNLSTSRDSTSVLHQMSVLIKTRKEKNLPLENLLALIVHIYSLIGIEVSFSKQHEDVLFETLSVAIFEDHKTLFNMEAGQMVSPEACVEIAKTIMERLKIISKMRQPLQKYDSVLKPCEYTLGEEYRGILQQLVDDAVDVHRPDLTDLLHRTDGIKDLLLTGLNLLTSKRQRSKHPLDNQTVIIFVIGGITADECKRLHRSVITSGVDNIVLFGSTKLVAPVEAMRDALSI